VSEIKMPQLSGYPPLAPVATRLVSDSVVSAGASMMTMRPTVVRLPRSSVVSASSQCSETSPPISVTRGSEIRVSVEALLR
jgi:hypothetical protein